jgi:hypothetical protein
MPGKGKPCVSGDPRHRPGPGRPKKAYLQAAQDLLNRAYGKPKETVQVDRDSPIVVITTPDGKA